MKKVVFSICIFAVSILVQAQKSPIQLQDIVDGKYRPTGLTEMRSLPDGEHYTVLSSDGKAILRYAYKNGQLVDTLFYTNTTRETKLNRIEGYIISNTGHRIIVWTDKEYIYRRSWKANLYDYDVRRNFLKPLSDYPDKLMNPTFSPDGRMCAFIRDNDIWLKKFDYDTESEVTKDGEFGKVLNGLGDWVYEEEFRVTNLMSWSSDSKFLAFVKSDESEVPTFEFQVFDGNLYPGSYSYKYPKPGQRNSVVGAYAYNVETKDIKRMNLPIDENSYIPKIYFTENPDQLAVMTLNRHQNQFNMYYANPKSTVSRLIFQDENKYYVNSDWIDAIHFTKDNFLYVSEKDGFSHIYLYTINGVLQKQLTSGNWDVTALYGYDPVTKTVYYQSAEESPLCRSVYKIDEKGNKTKLSTKEGTNSALFSFNFQYYIHNFSDLNTPNIYSIHDNKGKQLFVLNDNASLKQKLSETAFSSKEFFTFNNAKGDVLNGWMMKPLNFDSNKKYPVLIVQYNGPDSQEVLNRFSVGWECSLTQQGYIVASVDTRGTGARGEEFRKCTYMQLGILESDDLIASARYLGNLNYIDANRIGVWGWSYGGYMTLMSMSRGNGVFKAGIAIAPVTDWRYYDSIYTERFMRTPQENAAGYDISSALQLAENLEGKLLLVHGTSDDNVHYLNALYYSDALIEAGKIFDMQIYSNKNHSLLGSKTRMNLYNRIIDFLNRNL
jgi:Dipeptidyl aminopeptidases/acylaminoacyl-peptidases